MNRFTVVIAACLAIVLVSGQVPESSTPEGSTPLPTSTTEGSGSSSNTTEKASCDIRAVVDSNCPKKEEDRVDCANCVLSAIR